MSVQFFEEEQERKRKREQALAGEVFNELRPSRPNKKRQKRKGASQQEDAHPATQVSADAPSDSEERGRGPAKPREASNGPAASPSSTSQPAGDSREASPASQPTQLTAGSKDQGAVHSDQGDSDGEPMPPPSVSGPVASRKRAKIVADSDDE